jgi:hypothetical protein
MIKIEHTDVYGWEAAIRGMRNPVNSWHISDSYSTHIEDTETLQTAEFEFFVGDKDLELMKKLEKLGSDHAKYRRMINVTCDITAPLYWWKEYDTYKVGTVANSCSTMHKIHEKALTLDDFSHEHLSSGDYGNLEMLKAIITCLNVARLKYTETGDKDEWWQMIQLLPSSYNQRRTVQLNYEVLANMYRARRYHKLDEWRSFCEWIEGLPYSEIITGEG